jgi:hypothetical protein
MKLALLVLAFCAIGFFGVLVIDVGASMIGKIRFGEVEMAALWEKVVDRFLDRDVPRAESPPRTAPPAAPPRPTARPAPRPDATARAPLPAARPEDDARHAAERPERQRDREVEEARKRLDALLDRL